MGRNIFQPINVLHHFLNTPCPAGNIFSIQAIGETTNKAQMIGILTNANIAAVKRLNKKVNANTKANNKATKAPKTP